MVANDNVINPYTPSDFATDMSAFSAAKARPDGGEGRWSIAAAKEHVQFDTMRIAMSEEAKRVGLHKRHGQEFRPLVQSDIERLLEVALATTTAHPTPAPAVEAMIAEWESDLAEDERDGVDATILTIQRIRLKQLRTLVPRQPEKEDNSG